MVANHTEPELSDEPAILADTATDLRTFNEVEAANSTTAELHDAMKRYPHGDGPGSLLCGAEIATARVP